MGAGRRVNVTRGDVVVIDLVPALGHEQRGIRPCVVVSDHLLIEWQRFPLIDVIPLTSTPMSGWLYPRCTSESTGLRLPSVALVDQVRSVSRRRMRGSLGTCRIANSGRLTRRSGFTLGCHQLDDAAETGGECGFRRRRDRPLGRHPQRKAGLDRSRTIRSVLDAPIECPYLAH